MLRRRHLYLVLDDWAMGYSIRKIDDLAYSCCYAGLQPLPRPIYQLEAPRGMATSFTASLARQRSWSRISCTMKLKPSTPARGLSSMALGRMVFHTAGLPLSPSPSVTTRG